MGAGGDSLGRARLRPGRSALALRAAARRLQRGPELSPPGRGVGRRPAPLRRHRQGLLVAISEEYERELRTRPATGNERRAELVERILAGELIDASELAYGFEGWHLGLLATGPGVPAALRSIATALDRSLLLVERGGETAWAWVGSRRAFGPDDIERLSSFELPIGVHLAFGEPAENLAGWRLTHRQAAAALPIALRGAERIARYGDAPLLAATLQDDLLATSLRQLYLEPLGKDRTGIAARQTLRAYFKVAGNISSAAALGVNRATVTSRLAVIEERIGRRLDTASAEMQTALRLDEIDTGAAARRGS